MNTSIINNRMQGTDLLVLNHEAEFQRAWADPSNTRLELPPVDGDIEASPLEITLPHGYDGPISCSAFRRAVGQYYRSLVDRGVLGTRSGEDNTRKRDNTFLVPRSFEFSLGGNQDGTRAEGMCSSPSFAGPPHVSRRVELLGS